MKERKSLIPPSARYPIFLVGLVVLIGVGVVGIRQNFSLEVETVIGVVGFLLLLISIAVR